MRNEYLSMTLSDLLKYAKKNGIIVKNNMKKVDILSLVITFDLQNMTLPELKEYAKQNSIAVPSKLNKTEVVALVRDAKLSSITEQTVQDTHVKRDKSLLTAPGRTTLKKVYGSGKINLNVCTVCPKCGEEVRAVYHANSENEKYNTHSGFAKLFAKCPNCNSSLGIDENRMIAFFESDNLDDAFRSLYERMMQAKKDLLQEETQKFIESIKNEELPSGNNVATKILSSKDDLKKYILYLIHMESEIYFLKERIATLQADEVKNQQSAFRTTKMITSAANAELLRTTYELRAKIEEIEYEIANPGESIVIDEAKIEKELSIDAEKPEAFTQKAPVEPEAITTKKPVKPSEPVYEKAGLFNKKRVAAENEQKTADYNYRMSLYEQDLQLYEQDCLRYEEALKEYKRQKKEYAKSEIEYNNKLRNYNEAYKEALNAAIENARKAAGNDLSEQKQVLLIEKKQELSSIEEIHNSKTKEELASIPQLGISKILEEELKVDKKELQAIVKTRNELYSYNIIYGKYRNYVALTTLYEYLDSGRCDSLDGPQGAYNLYESETRSNEIIVQLKTIATSLESIKANQFMLYNELKQVNRGLEELNASMGKAISEITKLQLSVNDVKSQLSTISNQLGSIDYSAEEIRDAAAVTAMSSVATAYNTAATAHNTALTAHYSAITAHYARVNAEINNAIGFLIAMK